MSLAKRKADEDFLWEYLRSSKRLAGDSELTSPLLGDTQSEDVPLAQWVNL